MKPIEFPEQNVIFAKDQPEYQPLPAFKNNSNHGEVVSCWKLSFVERLRILFTGKLWVSMMTFNQPLTPSFYSTKKSDVLTWVPGKKWYSDYITAFLSRPLFYTITGSVYLILLVLAFWISSMLIGVIAGVLLVYTGLEYLCDLIKVKHTLA